ncbi:abscisic-aldehyde oxidase-like [Impatiens glandulifera]|uniref:abscisic-aldehyde oxidase-like n=1 Tax=Impatiens glandulifera TaxID=253017 RepID=UPI001FB16118|nr:abscisic-aldehyde oxidase-like [Impatiens glandulifera]
MEEEALVFAINGERFEVSNFDPSITLLEYLRSHTRFKSVKLSCGEGGCGACVVLLSRYDSDNDEVKSFTVSSCLTLLCSIDKCSITTSEGLGNSRDGFHPIHERFAGFHASQCGFCTPGMCMSLFSAIVNAEKMPSKLTVSEAELAISGNLCRCTGYRPIADACKSFASDVDMEDLGLNSFWKKGDSSHLKADKLPFYDRDNQINVFPQFLKNELGVLKRQSWYTPTSLLELQVTLKSILAEDSERVKLVVGNTGMGYYKEIVPFHKYIDLRYIPELSVIRMDQNGIEIGAAITISEAISALKKENEAMGEGGSVFLKIANHMEKIASGFVRNSASIGGNLVMAQRKHFPSDIVTILLAVGSTVKLQIDSKLETVLLEEFLEWPPLNFGSVLLSIQIPHNQSNKIGNKVFFETYRASPRPLGNALPYLNAAFLAEVSHCETTNGVIINNIRLAFGAYGVKHAIRARKIEEFLVGKKSLRLEDLLEAITLLRGSIIPEVDTTHAAYRCSLAVSFLFEFLHPLINARDGLVEDSLEKTFDRNEDPGLLLSGSQMVESNQKYYPVGKPIEKTGATIQASGEAVFVDDIPSPPRCLHAAFIYSTKPLARVKCVKTNPELLPVDVISFHDIPKSGANVGAKTMFGPEPLFADELTMAAGQPLALVVADTQKHADMAASSAIVDYDFENLEPPILTVEDAVQRSSFFEVPPIIYPKQIGDFSRGMDEADHKIISAEIRLGSQYYFYMESQCALAIPDEDNCMVIYSSIQCPEYLHSVVASCLGVPDNNIRVITRRVGGGFGGKAIRAMPVATACALAAYKLQRPVRIYVNRKTDTIMVGGRHPMKITYSVGFKSDGKITALHLDILINAGFTQDISPIMPHNIMGPLRKYNWGALSFDMKVCKTNLSSKSAMRAPGEVQGSFIAEAVIEHVAYALSIEADIVRKKNMHTFDSLNIFYGVSAGESHEYTLPSIYDKLAVTSHLDERIEKIKEFNGNNKWRKRAISLVPIIHEVFVRATPGKVSILSDGSIVVEVGGIELGQGLWTKVKQMTAFALSSNLCNADGEDNLLDKVRVVQADTLSLVQGGFTAGSTTSESSCEAVRLCCDILVERLMPIKKSLSEQSGSVKWETLITTGHLQSVNFTASSFYVPVIGTNHYLNYGAAVSEVEVNLLTGGTRILQSDIIYDCGQSLNPAVDLGQIEGAFVQGIGFFMLEEYLTNSDGLVVTDSTWTYKIPTIDTIPKRFNVEILNSNHHKNRVLSSKASGEPPLLLAASVHCATRAAIKEARKQLSSWRGRTSNESDSAFFQLPVPASMPVVKELCGLDNVECYLESLISRC